MTLEPVIPALADGARSGIVYALLVAAASLALAAVRAQGARDLRLPAPHLWSAAAAGAPLLAAVAVGGSSASLLAPLHPLTSALLWLTAAPALVLALGVLCLPQARPGWRLLLPAALPAALVAGGMLGAAPGLWSGWSLLALGSALTSHAIPADRLGIIAFAAGMLAGTSAALTGVEPLVVLAGAVLTVAALRGSRAGPEAARLA